MNNSSALFVDGTFNASPSIFGQLIVVIGLQKVIENIQTFPCLYALIPGKKQEYYSKVFKELKKLCPNLKPEYVMSDFEQAIINVLKSNFKSAAHKCCLIFCLNFKLKISFTYYILYFISLRQNKINLPPKAYGL